MKYTVIILLVAALTASGQTWDNVFQPTWHDLPWSEGGLTPTGSIWSLRSGFDLDQDGRGEFLYSSSWSGSFGNDAVLYESTGTDSFKIDWYAWFPDLDAENDNYSVVNFGDLDGDGNPEIIVLNDCLAGQDALHIFEYDQLAGRFPATATATWDLGLSGGVLESSAIQIDNIDSDPQSELIMAVYGRDPLASHLIIAELANGSDLSSPQWNVEMNDDSSMSFYCYALCTGDLDGDGQKEVHAVEWNYNRLLMYENQAEDNYRLANDFYLSEQPLAFSNEGLVAKDFDADGLQELYVTSIEGKFWVLTNNGDIEAMNFTDSAHLLDDKFTNGGFVFTQVISSNADSPEGQIPDGADLYLAAVDTAGTVSRVFDWEYQGGDVSQKQSYQESVIYEDTGQNDALFGVAKIASADLDNDGRGELVLSSFSLNRIKPHVQVLEHGAVSSLDDPGAAIPGEARLYPSFPNPFNPQTNIHFFIPKTDRVEMHVFDITGRLVRSLINREMAAGWHTIKWDGLDQNGALLSSGTYILQMLSGDLMLSQKLTLLR